MTTEYIESLEIDGGFGFDLKEKITHKSQIKILCLIFSITKPYFN